MKENSIEEDIKNAEHFINSIKTDKEYKEGNGWHGYYNKEIVELARMLEHILSNYKRVLKENERYQESDYGTICLENNGLSEFLDRIQSEYNDLINELLKLPECKLYGLKKCKKNALLIIKEEFIPVQKVKAKIEKEIKYHGKNILDIENITMLKGKTAKEEAEIEFNKYAIVVLKKMLQELLESEE